MATKAIQARRRTRRRKRAGGDIGRCAPMNKHGAEARGHSPQWWSEMKRGRTAVLDEAYRFVEEMARGYRTTPTPIGSGLITHGTEVAYGDLEVPGLLRELSIRMEALRDGAEAAMEVAGIVQLLSERGVLDA